MKVTRLDLDGKGSGSPEGLVGLIFKAEPLTAPVPIEDLARALDITEIAELTTQGFEGGLLTDQYRSQGIILVNRSANPGRRRFTIGHELAHFLLPSHKPVRSDRFLCSRDDMATWSANEHAAYQRMEAEANSFAALILLPPQLLRRKLPALGDPNLNSVLRLHQDYIVSKDAAARAYAKYHHEPVAVLVVRHGVVQRFYCGSRFPRFAVKPGAAVPRASAYHTAVARSVEMTDIGGITPDHWIEPSSKRRSELYEQILLQQNGYALVLLWHEAEARDDDADADDLLTSSEHYAQRRGQRLRG